MLSPLVAKHRKADHPIEDIILARWSPRAMSGRPVDEGQLKSLFEAARWAASSYNEQPWRFVYARRDTPEWGPVFGLLTEANQAWCKNAGVLMVVLSKNTFTHNGSPNRVHTFDAGAAWANLALQGTRLGLVVHGMAGFDAEKARSVLRVPEGFSVEAMIAVGQPGKAEELPEKLRAMEFPSGRKPISEFVFEGAFRG